MTSVLKPDWLRVKAPQRERIGAVADLLLDLKLNTVCQEASCPNIGECFAGGTATFLIMGPGCTRACPYCDIDFDKSVRALDPTEPERLGEAVSRLKLKHVVITSVNRDDLSDGGASQFVACIEQVKRRSPFTTIELLIPDLCGNWDALETVMAAAPRYPQHLQRSRNRPVGSRALFPVATHTPSHTSRPGHSRHHRAQAQRQKQSRRKKKTPAAKKWRSTT